MTHLNFISFPQTLQVDGGKLSEHVLTFCMWAALAAALLPLARFLSEHWLNCAKGRGTDDKLRCWGCRLQTLLPSGVGIAGA